MELNKAIEILSASPYAGMPTYDQDFKNATNLGIEALKRMNLMRSYNINEAKHPLPGERSGF